MKYNKDNWPKSESGRFICNEKHPMPKDNFGGRWEHTNVSMTEDDDDNYHYGLIEKYKCKDCGIEWRAEGSDY